jgi:hypothetical protein
MRGAVLSIPQKYIHFVRSRSSKLPCAVAVIVRQKYTGKIAPHLRTHSRMVRAIWLLAL